MTGKTHAMIGANAAWLIALAGIPDQSIALFGIVGALAALLPDIDAAQAKIHYVAGGAFGAFRNMGKHRGFFHSFLVVLLIFILSFIFLYQYNPFLPLIVTIGYASHPLIDALNSGGVQYLFPLKKKYRIVPRALTVKVGGTFDQLLFIAGMVSFLFLLFLNYL